jgi:hypothetical protein
MLVDLRRDTRPRLWRRPVDTYAVQHPGTSSRRAIQSVGAHLIGLHMALEQGAPPSRVIDTLRRATAQSDRFWWLDPPSFAGTPTILDILDVPPAEDADRITRWAGAVWHAWSPHHATVRDWAQLQRE